MSRPKAYVLLAGALFLVGLVAYQAYRGRPQPQPLPAPTAGLAWLPGEAGLVAGINIAEIRNQPWLLELIRRVSGEVQEGPDYRAFVEATGFDYTRDLDQLWVGVFGPSGQPLVVGVVEGRFAREKILAEVARQRGLLSRHQGVSMYEVQTGSPPGGRRLTEPPRRFAFAFLDEAHLAFASELRGVAAVVDCWQGRAPAVGSDALRRAGIERVAAGRQLWLVDELGRWQPRAFLEQQSLQNLLTQAALGVRVSEEGLELEAEARCRESQQAERLRDNLRIALLAGRLALGRQTDRASQALAETISTLDLTQQGDIVRARVLLGREALAALLGTSAATLTRP